MIPPLSLGIVEFILASGLINVLMQIAKKPSHAVPHLLDTKIIILGPLKKQQHRQRLVYDKIKEVQHGLLKVSTQKPDLATRHLLLDSKLQWD